MTIQIHPDNNNILITDDNKIAAHADCCCGPEEGCPMDTYMEENCNSSYSCTISGFTDDCDVLNMTKTLTYNVSLTYWLYDDGDITITLGCNSLLWDLAISMSSTAKDAKGSITGYTESCPGGNYNMNNAGYSCTGGTAVVS
jgi:hypothetical protein